ncbi:MAG TPA: glycogen debranching N-terminal domain-containing protein [Steroidobacteraceae bacterium]|jgi:glycogen debranching enzyme|nr:glycogen debranching N-terminal domain-containing protein [Steroidobacteraceae bacterium]
MSSSETLSGDLTEPQHRSRERSLTGHHASRAHHNADSVVLAGSEMILVSDARGDVPREHADNQGLGLYYRDTRFLSAYELTLNGASLVPLSSHESGGAWAFHLLSNPSLESAGGECIGPHTISICRDRAVGEGAVHDIIAITNFGAGPVHLSLELAFAADFTDIFVVRGIAQPPPPTCLPAQIADDRCVELCSVARDGTRQTTRLGFSIAATRLRAEAACFDLDLDSGERRELVVEIAPRLGTAGSTVGRSRDAHEILREREREGREWLTACAEAGGDPVLERIIRRSLLDLKLLRTPLHGGHHYIAGGIPWFATLFGRDSALSALEVCGFRAAIAGDTARVLARYQADRCDTYRDAQPGKIAHELRQGTLARLGEIPQSPAYYGTVDATPLFIILIGEYLDWSGDLALVRELRGNIDAALGWIDRFGDSDGDGYLDYRGAYGNGLVNQGWKDSGIAITNSDGSLATPPIALCEAQGYLYRAWLTGARLLALTGDEERARSLEARAAALRERFERDFWSERLGCYVLALQRGGRPVEVVTSNAGQVLWSGIASAEHALAVAQRLMQSDMFSGWGIRTLSSREQRYNPLSYQLGSVWPHDNALILAGLKRYGCAVQAQQVFAALHDAAGGLRAHRLPELYAGFDRRPDERHPVRYPVACSPQAWAAAALPYALVSLLGLQPDARAQRLRLADPRLPPGVDRLTLARLRVGAALIDLSFLRSSDDNVAVSWKVVQGPLLVESVPAGNKRQP